MKKVEALVLGSGVVGTAATLEFARRGVKVLGVDMFSPGHARGSSGGPTRIFRVSYQEAEYVQLSVQAIELYNKLQSESGARLLTFTGSIDLGGGAAKCADSLSEAGIEFEELGGSDLKKRFGLNGASSMTGLYQKDAGVINAHETVRAQRALAQSLGASFLDGLAVTSIELADESASVVTADGLIHARHLVVAAGPWMVPLAATAGVTLPLNVTLEQVSYFDVAGDLPVVIDWDEPARYLVPAQFDAPGVRAGLHHSGPVVDPDDGPFEPKPEAATKVGDWLAELIGRRPNLIGSETCLYTNAPNEDFIFQVSGAAVFVSACSGHGFKFGPVSGRAAVDLALGLEPLIESRLVIR